VTPGQHKHPNAHEVHKRGDPMLFLDFDGVLHPVPGCREDIELFAYAPLLEAALEPHPDVRIVLSTSWVEGFGYEVSQECLPESLQQRVIGSTYHSRMKRDMRPEWHAMLTRYAQIANYVKRHAVTRWLALDDDDTGWPPGQRRNLVRTPGRFGLSYPDAQTELADKLLLLAGQQ
jgi:hypothetical protein